VAGVLGDWSYTYDAQNRLIRAVGGPSSVVAEFYYDARNRCVKRVINGVTTYLIYDGWSLLEERNLAGNLLAHYYHGPVIDELLCRVTETNTVYYHHDGLGSTVALTDSTGNVVESYTYDVYGQPSILSATYQLLPTSSVTNRFLFTGREYLAELALYDYRHRFYSPSLGRFLQTDPLRFDADDVNLYSYLWQDPINDTDSDGLFGDGINRTGYPHWKSWFVDPPSLGHSDFYGGDRFDYTKEDYGETSPWRQPQNHFQSLRESVQQARAAIARCKKENFERAMHRVQDFYSHYKKGYRWAPKERKWGHVFAGSKPDADRHAWREANQATYLLVKEWDANCCKCGDSWNIRSRGPCEEQR